MLNKHKLQRIAIATTALMAFGSTQLIANAETLTLNGSITGPTCAVGISGANAGGGTTGTYTLNLGNITQSATTALATGETLVTSTPSVATFALTTPGTTTACSAPGVFWDISVAPTQAGFILTNQAATAKKGETYLKNMIAAAQGGTDAAVVLKAAVGATVPATAPALALNDNGVFAGINSVLPTFTTSTASSISISAQFVHATNLQKPTSGNYNHTLNLGITYR